MEQSGERSSVLIVDDSPINREMLSDILEEEFNIYEAANGREGLEILQEHLDEIAVVLLDLMMPVMDGYGMLKQMNKKHYINAIPVIIISGETAEATVVKGYDLGAVDYISKPFNSHIVWRRVTNTIQLYNRQYNLQNKLATQIVERQKMQNIMIGILSHIVEAKNGESGLHILHINKMTQILLQTLVKRRPEYRYLAKDIDVIATASSLHDIGKMSIPDEILNKPGKLTDEEYEIMKTHPVIGYELLMQLSDYKEEKVMKYAAEICRWHHERYNGRGYPDGLEGDEIPIAAQIVSIADVYDALTIERVYKRAFSSNFEMEMSLNEDCGAFHPMLLECLMAAQDRINTEMCIDFEKEEE